MLVVRHKQKEMHNCSALKTVLKPKETPAVIIALKEQLSSYDKSQNKSMKSVEKVLTPAQKQQKLKINLIKLKMKAKSPNNCSVPTENRRYFQLIDRTNKNINEPISLIVNKTWSFSRVCDFIIDKWAIATTKILIKSEYSQKEIRTDETIENLLQEEIVYDGDDLSIFY